MKKILFVVLAALISACASQKQVVKTETETKTESVATVAATEVRTSETRTYGDSLTGESFIPADIAAPLVVESAGVRFNLNLKPHYAADGRLTGHQVAYQAIAKPTSKTNESVQQQSAAFAWQHIQHQEQVTEKQTKPFSWLTWLLVDAVVLFFIALVIWIIKTYKNG